MTPAPRAPERRRCRVQVTGIVQGVGFRPFVHRLAARHALAGWVRNESGRVEIDVDGAADSIAAFLADLRGEAPPLARIDRVLAETRDLDANDEAGAAAMGFRILESRAVPGERQPVPADVAMCAACERELFDPADRRHGYAFITCTDCGPRYTVIEALPYDRERTTMRRFTQCPACAHEYATPGHRRYHSETNSCPTCGPRLWAVLAGEGGAPPPRTADDAGRALRLSAAFLRAGAIVAVRGVGGFHLAVDATNDDAVRRLRARKHRDAKPFAVMVRTLDDARAIAHVSADDAAALVDQRRPIVLLRPRDATALAASVAPGLETIGVMLAYSPLHHLLLARAGRPLVMTSGNRSEEPIAASIADGLARLSAIADLFLLHDREIESPVDDSVVRAVRAVRAERMHGASGGAAIVRRARGFAPVPIALPRPAAQPILAAGAQLKSTFTLAAGREAFVSPHLGDLDKLETLEHYRKTLDRYSRLFRIVPAVVAHDLHPGYASTRLAHEADVERRVAVQHHHAHIAAVLGEHGVDERVIGVAFDGTGAGDDGTAWGAELLVADHARYERVGYLRPVPLAGGDLAVRTPWRTALGYASLEPGSRTAFAPAFDTIDDAAFAAAARQLARGINAPLASSMGRLFDAAAAVLGVCRVARFEGEAAMRLEALAGTRRADPLPVPARRDARGRLVLDPVPLLAALGELTISFDAAELAAVFHESIAAATADAVRELAAAANLGTVALGGGVFQNARLTAALRERLEAQGLRVLVPRDLPANDGAVSYGQAVVAAAVMSEC